MSAPPSPKPRRPSGTRLLKMAGGEVQGPHPHTPRFACLGWRSLRDYFPPILCGGSAEVQNWSGIGSALAAAFTDLPFSASAFRQEGKNTFQLWAWRPPWRGIHERGPVCSASSWAVHTPSLSEGDRSAALGCPSLASGPCSGKLMEVERTNLKVSVGSSVLQSLPPFLSSMHSAPLNL